MDPIKPPRRRSTEKGRVLAVLLIATVLCFLFWRRSVLLTNIDARIAKHPVQPLLGGRPAANASLQHLQRGQHPVFAPVRHTTPFAINISANQYPTIGDVFKQREGTYEGVGFQYISNATPRAYLLYDVLSMEDCSTLVKVAADQMARSEVVHAPGQAGINSVRTSYGMFIMQPVDADLRLRQKIAAMVGVPVVNIEATQILRYYPGQYYRVHPDYFYSGAREHLARGGQRIATSLTWLNDVATGGQTSFPMAKPQPITVHQTGVGNSILFYSVTEGGDIDPGSQHEAIPPGEGSMKWVAVNWIRQREFH